MSQSSFAETKAKVVQLLKDWKLPYSTSRGSAPDADTIASVCTGGLSGGSWNLNAEVLRRWKAGKVADSHRLLLRELLWLSEAEPELYRALGEVFLHDAAGDADYEYVQHKAADGYERFAELLQLVEAAIGVLTVRLMSEDLYVIFGERMIKTRRRQSMEESYREIYRIFESFCRELAPRRKRYRNKAIESTAIKTGYARSTVQRAIHFVEAGDVEREAS